MSREWQFISRHRTPLSGQRVQVESDRIGVLASTSLSAARERCRRIAPHALGDLRKRRIEHFAKWLPPAAKRLSFFLVFSPALSPGLPLPVCVHARDRKAVKQEQRLKHVNESGQAQQRRKRVV